MRITLQFTRLRKLTPRTRIVSLLFETILFALTMLRFCAAVREGWGRGPVLRRFVSDGTWAYALVFATMLVNMMLYKYVRSTLTGICYTCVSSHLPSSSPFPDSTRC